MSCFYLRTTSGAGLVSGSYTIPVALSARRHPSLNLRLFGRRNGLLSMAWLLMRTPAMALLAIKAWLQFEKKQQDLTA